MKNTIFSVALLLATVLWASSPKTSTHTSKTDFSRGTPKNITITHDGIIKPGPVKTKIADTGQPLVWDMVADSKGAIYLATGNEGKLYKTTAQGDTTLVFDADEVGIFTVAIDAADNLYAATSPNGKVYKIDPEGNSTEFFDPDAMYIWDMLVDDNNRVLIATGDDAYVYRIAPDGESELLYEGEENHARTLTLSQDETLYLGTSGDGYIYKLSDNAPPFVVFDPQMEEVHGLIEHTDGYLYAAVYGESVIPMLTDRQQRQNGSNQSNNGNDEDEDNEEAALAAQTIRMEGIVRLRGGSTSLFRISPDGYAKDLWVGSDEKIQSIFPYSDTELLVGSGKSGNLLTINTKGELSILQENEETHVTAFLRQGQRIYYSTANLGRLYALESALSDTAQYMSETIDAGLVSQWGILTYDGDATQADLLFFTRSGNTEQPLTTWSDWAPAEPDGDVWRINSPEARFVQWKCEFRDKDAMVEKVTLSYLQKNKAPAITAIVIHSPGDFYEASSKNSDDKGIAFPSPVSNKKTKKGFRSVDWIFEDPNMDRLMFDLFYRRVGETHWRQLAEELSSNVYSWDSAQMADGEYEIKIVATDGPSNPEPRALQGIDISKPFIVDNSGPVVDRIKTGNNENQNVLTFRIKDEWNTLDKVEYSIDAGSWNLIYPVDELLDSKTENFEIILPDADVHDVAIKAADRIDNVTVVHARVN